MRRVRARSLENRLPRAVSPALDPQGGARSIMARGQNAVALLLEASQFARELGREAWDFSLEIATLRETGLTCSDLRWLVCKGYLEQANEVTSIGHAGRMFEPAPLLSFTAATCFVLSPEGRRFARSVLAHRPEIEPSPAVLTIPVPAAEIDAKPSWDSDRQELRVGTIVVKQFKVPAVSQETILAAFQEEGWPVRIDDPLPPHPAQDSKRRLHDTINSLNRNQKEPLIRFLGDGSGQGVRWELLPRQAPGRNGDAAYR